MKTLLPHRTLACLLGLGLVTSAGAGTLTDNFDASHDYLANGLVGTIWDGVYLGTGEFPNVGLGGSGPGSTLRCDANVTRPNTLSVQTFQTDWEWGDDDGFFLFKNVSGDFQVSVHILTPYNNIAYNTAGLMARATDAAGAPFKGAENHVHFTRFDEYGFANYGRSTVNNNTTQVNPGDPQGADLYWLMLERVGDTFNCYQKTNETDAWIMVPNCTFQRSDLNGVPMQVGIMQAIFSGNSPTVQFEKFSLTGPNVNPSSPPPAASGLTITPTAQGDLAVSWTPGTGSGGSVVIVRKDAPIARQPSYGVAYTGNAVFGNGEYLGPGTYVAYSGSGSNFTFSAPGGFRYYFAVYSYAGSGSALNYNLATPAAGSALSPAVLQSVTVAAPSELLMYASAQATVTATYANGLNADVTALASYSSDNPHSVSVAAGGLITANAHGSATITASYGGKQNTQLITVTDPAAATLVHRYSFNDAPGSEMVADSVGTANGTNFGLIILDGTQAYIANPDPTIIPAQSWIELPQNLLSSLDSVTVETWISDLGSGAWARLFDFGASYSGPGASDGGSNYLALSYLDGGGAIRAMYGYDPYEINFTAGRPAGTNKVHVVLTSYAPAHTALIYVNGRLGAVDSNWYVPGTTSPATPAALGPTYNDWIGRSQYPDPGFNGLMDEFRIYNGALSPLQVLVNSLVGPDQAITPGALQSVTLTVESSTMKKNGSQQATVTGNFANLNNVPLTTFPDTTYTSSDPTIVAVNAQGKLTSFGKLGTVTITASYGGMNSSQDVTVIPFDSTGFTYNMQITFDGYSQGETLTNFPALIALSPSIANFNYSQFLSPDAADLRFVDAGGNELNSEIETWNTSGSSYVWVQVPQFSKGTSITAFWGKSGLAVPPYRTDGSTWSDGFTGVWHMNTNYVSDASGHGYNASAIVAEAAVTTTPGVIGSAQNYDATLGNGATSVGNIKPGSTTTLSAWVWLAEQNREGIFMCKDGNFFFWQQGATVRHERSPWGGDFIPAVAAAGGAAPAAGAWFHMAGTIDGTTQKIYINGQLRGTWTKTPDAINDNQWQIGGVNWGRIMNGKLDECRVDSVARSTAWIWACWKNQSSPTTFATLGAAYVTSAPLALAPPHLAPGESSSVVDGRVVSDGGVPFTSWGTVWGTAPAPTGNSVGATGSGRAPFSFTQTRTGFSAGNHYYVRAWASNSVSGVAYSPDADFYTRATPAGSVSFSGVGPNDLTVSWGPTTALGYLVVARQGAAVTAQPTDTVPYIGGSTFGAGPDLGGAQYVIYAGPATSTPLHLLMPQTRYYVAVYAYGGTAASPLYASSAATGNQTTTPVTATGVAFADAVLSFSPIAYWRFNESAGATTVQDLIGVHSGTYNAGSTPGVPGPTAADGFPIFDTANRAVSFDGTATAAPVTTPALNINGNNVTMMCWVKPAASPNNDRAGFFTCTGPTTAGAGFRYASGGVNLGCLWNNTALNSTIPIPANVWSFVAVAVSPAGATLYLANASGMTNQTVAGTLPVQGFDGAGLIGSDRNVGGRFYNGVLDDMAIFNYTMTPAQIGDIFKGVQNRPQLTVTPSGTNFVISWSAGFTGFTLKSSPVLGPSASWGNVQAPVVVANGLNTVTLSPANAAAFYQLEK